MKKLLSITTLLLFLASASGVTLYAHEERNTNSQAELSGNIGKSLQDELDEVNAKLDETRKKKKAIEQTKSELDKNNVNFKNSIDSLAYQIQALNQEIQEKQLLIQQLDLEIQILTEQIDELEGEIEVTEKNITRLEEETDQRLVNMYLTQKQNTSTSARMFAADGPSSLIKSDTYRQAFQEDTNQKLESLESARTKLEKDKQTIEDNKVQVDRNKFQVEEERIALASKKQIADEERKTYISRMNENNSKIVEQDKIMAILSDEEKKLLAQYDKIQSALLARNEVANGMPVKRGQLLGVEGDTGFAYGAHLHFGVSDGNSIVNPCGYLPGGAYGSCGGSGKLGKPLSGATFTSGFRTSSRPTHNAIDISSGGGGSVVAAHDGYAYFFFEPCPSWASVCNKGGALVAKVCENDGCSGGISTVYYHLRCTAEPSGSPRSCN